jgi:hypothetical protein
LLVANHSALLAPVGDEITIIGSFSETYKFPATIDYLDSGKVKVKGIVNKTFKLEQWKECLEAMKNKSAIVRCSNASISDIPLAGTSEPRSLTIPCEQKAAITFD